MEHFPLSVYIFLQRRPTARKTNGRLMTASTQEIVWQKGRVVRNWNCLDPSRAIC
jgi:hypothetical protein